MSSTPGLVLSIFQLRVAAAMTLEKQTAGKMKTRLRAQIYYLLHSLPLTALITDSSQGKFYLMSILPCQRAPNSQSLKGESITPSIFPQNPTSSVERYTGHFFSGVYPKCCLFTTFAYVRSLPSELVWSLSGSKNIAGSLQTFSVQVRLASYWVL